MRWPVCVCVCVCVCVRACVCVSRCFLPSASQRPGPIWPPGPTGLLLDPDPAVIGLCYIRSEPDSFSLRAMIQESEIQGRIDHISTLLALADATKQHRLPDGSILHWVEFQAVEANFLLSRTGLESEGEERRGEENVCVCEIFIHSYCAPVCVHNLCKCVCMNVCVFICMYEYIHKNVCVFICVYEYIHKNVCVFAHMCVCT